MFEEETKTTSNVKLEIYNPQFCNDGVHVAYGLLTRDMKQTQPYLVLCAQHSAPLEVGDGAHSGDDSIMGG